MIELRKAKVLVVVAVYFVEQPVDGILIVTARNVIYAVIANTVITNMW